MMRKIVWILGTLVIVVSIAWVNRIDILLQIPRIKAHFKEPIGPNREVVWDKGPMTSSESPSKRNPTSSSSWPMTWDSTTSAFMPGTNQGRP
jgi:hypothetical protein